ncbi:MAG: STAS domain-containing protein, partial [Lachnospiraceae bacterium]|nr:STAS domain-containing protein [Lachnospiraceae bacterium]
QNAVGMQSTPFLMQALVVGLVSLGVQILWPRVSKKIPGSLIAVLLGIGMVKLLNMKVNTIGDLYTITSALPAFRMPELSLELVKGEFSDAFTIAILAAIESLLSCVVSDGMIGARHDSNMELIGQGIGNIGSALFGGIPATGAIARTAANIKNGGRTPVAGMVHAVVLVLVLIILMPYAALIPMPTIAAILFMVAYNMCGWRNFVTVCRTAPKSDIMVLVITFVLTIVFDLVVAIEFGMIMTCVLFLKRMSEESRVSGWKYYSPETARAEDLNAIHLKDVPKQVRVYEITGAMFFGMTEALNEITVKDYTKCLIIRMRGVPSMDVSAMHSLEELVDRLQRRGIHVVLSHVMSQPYKVMEKGGLLKKIGKENVCVHIDAALARAQELINE